MAVVRGGSVLPHVQACADAVEAATGADSFGTYPGHEPTEDRAMDVFVPVDSDVLGNQITAFAIANMDKYGIWYIIYRQHIYNPEIGKYWRLMEDRGSLTQNHYDHVHFSFYSTAPNLPDPTPIPAPTPILETEDDEMYLINVEGLPGTYITDGDRAWGVPSQGWLDVFFYGNEPGKDPAIGPNGPFAKRHLGTIPQATFYTLRNQDGSPRNPGIIPNP